MTEHQLIALWSKARQHVIISQLGPIFLLIVTIGLLSSGLRHAPLTVRLATAGILLASGILGSLVQFSAATEAMAIAEDLRTLDIESALARRIAREAPWANVVKYVTPTIFVLVFLALLLALFVR
jgi:hypothetical protein